MSERERFEEWVRSTYGTAVNLSSDNDIYVDPFAMALFTGWQAHALLAKHEAGSG